MRDKELEAVATENCQPETVGAASQRIMTQSEKIVRSIYPDARLIRSKKDWKIYHKNGAVIAKKCYWQLYTTPPGKGHTGFVFWVTGGLTKAAGWKAVASQLQYEMTVQLAN